MKKLACPLFLPFGLIHIRTGLKLSRSIMTLLSVIAVLGMSSCLSSNEQSQTSRSNLPGYIEVVEDFGIKRIDLVNGRTEMIMKKRDGYYVGSFDLSPDNQTTVIAFFHMGKKPEDISVFSQNKELNTIISQNFVRYPSISPDGKKVAYLFSPQEKNRRYWYSDWFLQLADIDGKSFRTVSEVPSTACKPSWFPDGARIVFGSKDLKIHVVDIRNNDEKMIIPFGTCPAVSRDGRKIAYLANDVDEDMKRKIVKFRNITQEEYRAISQSSGNKIRDARAIERSFLEHSIYIYDTDTGETRKLSGNIFIEQPVIWSPDNKFLLYNNRGDIADKIYVINVKTGSIEKVTKETGRIMVWNEK